MERITYQTCDCEGCKNYREEKQIARQYSDADILVQEYLKQQGYATDTAT